MQECLDQQRRYLLRLGFPHLASYLMNDTLVSRTPLLDMPKMLCQTCLDSVNNAQSHETATHMQLDSGSHILTIQHHKTVTELEAAAEFGCYLCASFWASLTTSQKQITSENEGTEREMYPTRELWNATEMKISSHESHVGANEPDVLWIEISPTFALAGTVTSLHSNRSGVFRLVPVESGTIYSDLICSAHTLLQESSVSLRWSSNSSLEAWSVAESWIRVCTDTHTKCNRTKQAGWYPTRLLGLQQDYKEVRLLEASKDTCKGVYMTLSHRWSDNELYTLVKSNYELFREGVPVSDLPRAYRDAIMICQRLGVQMLWIDSLCIMQNADDLSDWMRGAQSMHQVYSNSFLNLSGLVSRGSDETLFVNRNLSALLDPQVRAAINFTNETPQWQEYRIVDWGFWKTEVDDAPLNLRGWVLQERLLCPRILHFGRQQLLWECHELEAAEKYPRGLPEVFSTNSQHFKDLDPESYQKRMWITPYESYLPPEMLPYQLWKRIVDAYSKCSTTKPKDKLIALAGVAKYVSKLVNDQYVAGMWRRYLASELLWHVENSENARRAQKYRAPTFSWASVDGLTAAGEVSQEDLLIQVLSIDLEYLTDDPFGLVTGGSMLLKCKLQKLALMHKHDGSETYNSKGHDVVINDTERIFGELDLPLSPDLDESVKYFDPTSVDQAALYLVTALEAETQWGFYVCSLLLQVVDGDCGIFRRFGLVACSDIKKRMERHCFDGEQAFPCVHYREGWHTIRVI